MNDFKFKQEVKNLMKIGLNEEYATLVVSAKYGNTEIANDILNSINEENEAIKEALQEFRPFEIVDTTGQINTDVNIMTCSSSSSSNQDYYIENRVENLELSSNCIEERNVENQK
jgi:hypothetical protein